MTIFGGQCVKRMRGAYETDKLINENLLRNITCHFGIGFLAIDVMAICWSAKAQYKNSELAAEQLFVPIDEFLRSHDKNSVCIVFDNAVRSEKKVASASRERSGLEAQGLPEEEFKKKLAEMNSRKAVSDRQRLQDETVTKLMDKLGELASRVTAVTAEASGDATIPNELQLRL